MENNRVNIENGPNIVRLNINRTLPSDAGMWRCDIRTESDAYVVNNGILVQTNVTVIGELIQHDIELIIIGSCYKKLIVTLYYSYLEYSSSWSAAHTLGQRE